METINLKLKSRSYQIVIGWEIIKKTGKYIKDLGIGTDAYIITNPLIKKKYGRCLQNALKKYKINYTFKTVADSENSKSLQTALRVIEDLAKFDRKKEVFIIAFGGGVIGDLSGFVASIYKRGIAYIQIPTTLLACADSSIGGKTAVDLKCGKNLVGAFYQPKLVLSELSFLKSLSLRQIRAGLAEVIKYAIIKDKKLFAYLQNKLSLVLNLEKSSLEYVITCCAEIKAKIIMLDEKEKKEIRTILNFGHTLGHAIEAASCYNKYNHGEAVGLGMIIASRISQKSGLIGQNTVNKIVGLIAKAGLPVFVKGLSFKKILTAFHHDKKFIGRINRLVLIKGIGNTLVRKDVPLNIIKDSLIERLNP